MPALTNSRKAADAEVPRDWGPTLRGRHRRVPRRLWVILLILLVGPLSVVAAAGMWGMSRITRVEVAGLGGAGPRHFLIVGSDSRDDLTPEERRELHTGSAPGDRTDTIFVLTVGDGRAAILAFPRDLLVTRCDGSTGRINGAEAIDGPGCLVDTIERTSGIGIDNYVAINFGGFRDLVDAVGGVRLCLEDAIRDRDAGIDLPAGCQVLSGRDALGYVRVRKIDNDLKRIERQQAFMRSLAGEIAAPATFVNPFRLFSVAGAAGGAITTDSGFDPLDAVALGRGLRAMQAGRLVADTVPTVFANVGGAEVLRATSGADALYAAHADGSILDRATGLPLPSEIEVVVRNGTSMPGLATVVADELKELGITVLDVNNAEPVEQTLLLFPPDLRSTAELLADLAPIPVRLIEDGAADTLELILGPDAAER
ncbi:MAG: LCP family protein [Nitriliruptorales bacterium]|nr:LCP family protein [Nitriliruptorales bacterium]